MTDEKASVGKCFVYSVMLGMLLSGSANTLVQKYQDQSVSAGNLFTHPYFQTLIMFTGELTVFGAYGLKKLWMNSKAKQTGDASLAMSPGTRQAGE